jgi:hypothetical protein
MSFVLSVRSVLRATRRRQRRDLPVSLSLRQFACNSTMEPRKVSHSASVSKQCEAPLTAQRGSKLRNHLTPMVTICTKCFNVNMNNNNFLHVYIRSLISSTKIQNILFIVLLYNNNSNYVYSLLLTNSCVPVNTRLCGLERWRFAIICNHYYSS